MAGVVSEQAQAWRAVVTDPIEVRVFEALANERWELRTIHGMARDAELSPDRVLEIIDKHAPLIHESDIPDSAGNRLFALRERAWRAVVTDPVERRVFEALADERWQLRTIHGMARDAKLSPDRVQEIIDKHAPLIRESDIPDSAGNRLFALRERAPSWREHLTTFIAVFTGSYFSIKNTSPYPKN